MVVASSTPSCGSSKSPTSLSFFLNFSAFPCKSIAAKVPWILLPLVLFLAREKESFASDPLVCLSVCPLAYLSVCLQAISSRNGWLGSASSSTSSFYLLPVSGKSFFFQPELPTMELFSRDCMVVKLLGNNIPVPSLIRANFCQIWNWIFINEGYFHSSRSFTFFVIS